MEVKQFIILITGTILGASDGTTKQQSFTSTYEQMFIYYFIWN